MAEAREAVIDALPYYDREIETIQGLRARVDREIQNELKAVARKEDPEELTSRLPRTAELFKDNELLQAELARAEARTPLAAIDTSRYQLPAPPEGASEEEWKKALDNAKAQLEYQGLRMTNVELLRQYGANAWRVHNFQQEGFAAEYERALEAMKDQTTEINRLRKAGQTEAGSRLTSLESRWTELVSRTLQVEVANLAGEAQLAELSAEEEKLKKRLAELDR